MYFQENSQTTMCTLQGQLEQMGRGGEFWQNMFHWLREWQTTSTFLQWEPN